jgi:hypothetical protein
MLSSKDSELETIFWPKAVTLALKLGIQDRAFLFFFVWVSP